MGRDGGVEGVGSSEYCQSFFSFSLLSFFSHGIAIFIAPGVNGPGRLWRAHAAAWYASHRHATRSTSDTAADLSLSIYMMCALTSMVFNSNAAQSRHVDVEVEPQSLPFQSCQIWPFAPRCLLVTALYSTIIYVCTNTPASCHEHIVSALRVCNYASHLEICTMTSVSSGLIDAITAIVELYQSTPCHDTQSALL